MTWTPALSEERQDELVDEYKFTDITVPELSVMFKVSQRTVYRILAQHNVRHRYNYNRQRKNKRKKMREPVPLKPCGTNAAYQRHKRAGEYPCLACSEAHAASVKESKPTPKPRVLKPCGTDAAHQRHLRNKEDPCDLCKVAHAKRTSKTYYKGRKKK